MSIHGRIRPEPTVAYVEHAPGTLPARHCTAIRQSDEVMCPRCGLRWELRENRPECPL